MKIGMLVNRMEGGGLEQLLLNITKELIEDHTIEIITTVKEGKWIDKVRDLGIFTKGFSIWSYSDPFAYIKDLAEFINSRSYDAIYINNTIYGIIASSFINPKTKKIAVLHGIYDNTVKLTTTNSKSIDHYIAISPQTYSILKEKIEKPNKVFLIPNGTYQFDDNKKVNKKRTDEKLKLIYSGRITHRDKGALFVPEIFNQIKQKLPSSELLVLGDGRDFDEFKKIIRKYKLNSSTSYFGMVDFSFVIEKMKESHFLLFPSIHEGFGLSIIEAQSVGCIPVAHNIAGVTDTIIDHHNNGILIQSNQIDDFSKEIISIYNDKSKMKYLSENATRNAKKFNIKNTAVQWVQVAELNEQSEKIDTLIKTQEGSKDSIIKMLNYDGSNELIQKKSTWLENYYHKNTSNLAILNSKCRLVIFGTLETAYYIYIDAIKYNLNIVAFIDNFTNEKALNNIPIWSSEMMYQRSDEFDTVISSIDSNTSNTIIKTIKERLIDKEIIDWKEI
ncbi:glycosyltransferase family 4 protein [Cytobacillus firmus]|uniref:glycosyltransferase family 4 protein n=1 Tax=Cytobacillus firmus TaxID=1399 RepID=UPI00218B5C46|nr:glycosyltransferase family 4 protein [Cytobacillus firmus]URM33465.1 glycosyltransferase family 4 protein [Cytobacillus firmus]